MKTEQLFYDSITDAARVVVLALGGPKKVGERLWSGKDAKAAERRLVDCLNDNREEKLSPDELLKLARWGRDAGCHALAVYFNVEAGYAPPIALTPADEKAELERQAIESVKQFEQLVRRYEAATRK
jgi:hypothetical protein